MYGTRPIDHHLAIRATGSHPPRVAIVCGAALGTALAFGLAFAARGLGVLPCFALAFVGAYYGAPLAAEVAARVALGRRERGAA